MSFTGFESEYESESANFNFEPWRINLNKFRLSLRAGSLVRIQGKIRIRESEPARRLVSSVPFPHWGVCYPTTRWQRKLRLKSEFTFFQLVPIIATRLRYQK